MAVPTCTLMYLCRCLLLLEHPYHSLQPLCSTSRVLNIPDVNFHHVNQSAQRNAIYNVHHVYCKEVAVLNWPRFLPSLTHAKHWLLRISFSWPNTEHREPKLSRLLLPCRQYHVWGTLCSRQEKWDSLGASRIPPHLPLSTQGGWRRGRCDAAVSRKLGTVLGARENEDLHSK